MRTVVGLTILVLASTAGDLLLARTMKAMGEVANLRPRTLLAVAILVIGLPSAWAGLFLQAVAFGSFLALLSWANVSLVVPASALGYVVGAIGAKFFLRETLSGIRWAGVLLVSGGVALVLAG
jgi:bacterial/archaeal transporter family protein